ncbi:hypothetical protein LZ32DRAFT_41992 [Colletotrichum eremochloae]|nr:hypothetical protein LZ32DRAFT_41992 [Colletotrichum eremochloae]
MFKCSPTRWRRRRKKLSMSLLSCYYSYPSAVQHSSRSVLCQACSCPFHHAHGSLLTVRTSYSSSRTKEQTKPIYLPHIGEYWQGKVNFIHVRKSYSCPGTKAPSSSITV